MYIDFHQVFVWPNITIQEGLFEKDFIFVIFECIITYSNKYSGIEIDLITGRVIKVLGMHIHPKFFVQPEVSVGIISK
ncbi:MAG: hypothetical protein ABI045_03490 [Flavobacteriales bacterium]